MNRREFLKRVTLATGGVLITPMLGSCGAAPAVAKTVGLWFAEYVVNLALDKVFDSISDYVSTQSVEESSRINATNAEMKQNGFTGFDGKKVYHGYDLHCYEVDHRDNFNGCAAFFDGQKRTRSLIEGPAVIGLAKAAEEYRRNGYTASDTAATLLPREVYQQPNFNAFGKSYDPAFVTITDFGAVIIDYAVINSKSGELSVTVTNKSAISEFEAIYQVTFN